MNLYFIRKLFLWISIQVVKVFNLMARTNETRHAGWYETCRCKCRLNASVCNNNNVGIMKNVDVNVKR